MQDLLLAVTSRSYGAIIQYVGSIISSTPLFNKSFLEVFHYICKDNKITITSVYVNLFMNNKTFYNHINNASKPIYIIDVCMASGFDFVLTMVLLSLKGFILNPNNEYDYKIMDFICNYNGTAEERLNDYINIFRPELFE